MYERARPKAWRYQPVGEARGMALHERQSLIVEMQACRSREFFQWAAPVLRAAFDGGGPGWDADNLYRLHCRRSEEHTSELQSLMRISYAVFCLKKKKNYITIRTL